MRSTVWPGTPFGRSSRGPSPPILQSLLTTSTRLLRRSRSRQPTAPRSRGPPASSRPAKGVCGQLQASTGCTSSAVPASTTSHGFPGAASVPSSYRRPAPPPLLRRLGAALRGSSTSTTAKAVSPCVSPARSTSATGMAASPRRPSARAPASPTSPAPSTTLGPVPLSDSEIQTETFPLLPLKDPPPPPPPARTRT